MRFVQGEELVLPLMLLHGWLSISASITDKIPVVKEYEHLDLWAREHDQPLSNETSLYELRNQIKEATTSFGRNYADFKAMDDGDKAQLGL
jgi:hypothetical protein